MYGWNSTISIIVVLILIRGKGKGRGGFSLGMLQMHWVRNTILCLNDEYGNRPEEYAAVKASITGFYNKLLNSFYIS